MYRTNWSAFSVPEFNDAQDNIKTINLDSLTDGICDAGYWAQPWIRRMASSIFRGDVPDSVLARVEVVSPSAAEHLRYVRAAGEYGALDFTGVDAGGSSLQPWEERASFDNFHFGIYST